MAVSACTQAVMMNPANNLSPDVTQRVLRALRISLTQRPLQPNPVIEAAMQVSQPCNSHVNSV